ncbi:MAG: hypothetical protein MI717_10035 [Spirochaetales bacterium]|nr:hypothetical protein [Spirochaetales bacterium]
MVIYLSVLGILALVIIFMARDFLFDGYTARHGALVASDGHQAFVVGGTVSDGDRVSSVYAVDSQNKSIQFIGELDSPLFGCSAVVSKNYGYVLGGMTKGAFSNVVYQFSLKNKNFKKLTQLPVSLSFSSALALNDRLYLMGGYDGEKRLDSIYCIQPLTGVCQKIGTLPEARDGGLAVTWKNRLFYIGGEGADHQRSQEIWEMDPQDGAVLATRKLPENFRPLSAVIYENQLMILGRGLNNTHFLLRSSLESSDAWDPQLTKVPLEPHDAGLAVMDDGLYVIGGSHPRISRQLGIWKMESHGQVLRPRRFRSHSWSSSLF